MWAPVRHTVKTVTTAVSAVIAAIGIACAATAQASSGSVYVRCPWGHRCLLTDYDQSGGAALATCQITSMG